MCDVNRGARPDRKMRPMLPPAAPPLPSALERRAREGAPYLVFHGAGGRERFDARACLAAAHRFGAALLAAGARPGDRVPILLPTSPDFVGAFFGAQLAGLVPVPLPTPLTFGRLDAFMERLERIVLDADARVIVTTGRYATAAAARPALAGALHATVDPATTHAAPTPRRWPSLDEGSPALLQYTSGTSGRPKGAAIAHGALAANTVAIAEALAITDRDVGLSWLPVFHDMGLIGGLCTAVTRAFEVHVLTPEAFVMRPERWLRTLTEVGATVSPAPNFAYELCARRITRDEGIALDGWRAALSGAEMVHAATLDRFTARFAGAGFARDAFTPVYGLAESTLAVAAPPPGRAPVVRTFDPGALERGVARAAAGDAGRRLVSVGQPVLGAELRIASGGRALGEGAVGEIQTRGPSLMTDYFRQPEASEAAFDDGWLRTGDLGFVLDGELFVSGRAKDVMVLGGRNVHPDDLEQVALEEPLVRGAAAAFSVADEDRGTERVILVVEVVERDPSARAALAKRLRGAILASLSVGVDEVALWPLGAIPRTTSGKVRRAACRDALLEARA